MRNLIVVILSVSLLAGPSLAACRDAKGKFIACAKAASASNGDSRSGGITKDAKGRCHMKGGKFVKCPA